MIIPGRAITGAASLPWKAASSSAQRVALSLARRPVSHHERIKRCALFCTSNSITVRSLGKRFVLAPSRRSRDIPSLSSRMKQSTTQVRTIQSEASTTEAPQHPLLRLLVEKLNSALLKPRSLPLPRWISPQYYSFTFSECFGHASFILVAVSYATEDFLQLRIMAVLGSASMLLFTYFHPHGRVLWLPLKWNMLFIALNSYRIGKVLLNRFRADQISPDLKKFREDHLNVMDLVDFYKLLRIAKEETFEDGDLILHQGGNNPYIRIVLEGELEVLRDGTLTYILEEGNFVSEAGLHAGLMLTGGIESCASIVVGRQRHSHSEDPRGGNHRNKVRVLCWDRIELIELLEDDKGLRNALKAALSWDIVRKLKGQRHMLSTGRVQDPAAWTMKRQDQGISRYAAILQNMLRNPEVINSMSEVLMKYRMIHHIGDEDHRKALAKCGWTEEEFRLGKKQIVDFEDDVSGDELSANRWRRVKRFSSKLVRSLL